MQDADGRGDVQTIDQVDGEGHLNVFSDGGLHGGRSGSVRNQACREARIQHGGRPCVLAGRRVPAVAAVISALVAVAVLMVLAAAVAAVAVRHLMTRASTCSRRVATSHSSHDTAIHRRQHVDYHRHPHSHSITASKYARRRALWC